MRKVFETEHSMVTIHDYRDFWMVEVHSKPDDVRLCGFKAKTASQKDNFIAMAKAFCEGYEMAVKGSK